MDTAASDNGTLKRTAESEWRASSPKRSSKSNSGNDDGDRDAIFVVVAGEHAENTCWVVLNRAQAVRFEPTFGELYDLVATSNITKISECSKKHGDVANAIARLAFSSSEFLAHHAGDTQAVRESYDRAVREYEDDCETAKTEPGFVAHFYLPLFSRTSNVQRGGQLEFRPSRVIRFHAFKD